MFSINIRLFTFYKSSRANKPRQKRKYEAVGYSVTISYRYDIFVKDS